MNRHLIFILFFSLLLFYSCSNKIIKTEQLTEISIQKIPLAGIASSKESEISGLAWYGDKLILLPQYPFLFGENGTGKLFFLRKKEIIKYLNGANTDALTPSEINFSAEGLEKFNSRGSGYEAVTFNADTVYMTIESYQSDSTRGYVVLGLIDSSNNTISLNSKSLLEIPSLSKIENFSEETLVFRNSHIYALHEANGKNLIDHPIVFYSDSKLTNLLKTDFVNVEYRITDATDVDADGSFWVINYFWPGEKAELNIANDELIEKYGLGISHQRSEELERLVKMKFSNGKIEFENVPPIYLELPANSKSRNWEGIAKLDDRGFLIVTDRFPETIFAFVPFNLK